MDIESQRSEGFFFFILGEKVMCSSFLLVLTLIFKTYIRYDMMGAEVRESDGFFAPLHSAVKVPVVSLKQA